MKIQIRFQTGAIINEECSTSVDFMRWLQRSDVDKVSFDFIDSARLALGTNGSFQIFGGVMNYPTLER